MWKEGEEVELNGKTFIVTKSCSIKRHIACRVCGGVNKCTPCIESNNYPESDSPFSVRECMKNMPSGYYLKEKYANSQESSKSTPS